MLSEGAGHQGPLTAGRWGQYPLGWALLGPPTAVCREVEVHLLVSRPLALPHIQESQALTVVPATASPVHSRLGIGCPVALQRNSAVWPGCTVSCGGWMETMGADGAAEAEE